MVLTFSRDFRAYATVSISSKKREKLGQFSIRSPGPFNKQIFLHVPYQVIMVRLQQGDKFL